MGYPGYFTKIIPTFDHPSTSLSTPGHAVVRGYIQIPRVVLSEWSVGLLWWKFSGRGSIRPSTSASYEPFCFKITWATTENATSSWEKPDKLRFFCHFCRMPKIFFLATATQNKQSLCASYIKRTYLCFISFGDPSPFPTSIISRVEKWAKDGLFHHHEW